MPKIILAIDSSLDACSVAIYKNKNIYSILEKCKNEHSTKILPMIKKILLKTETQLKELNIIAFSKGPGNFTGLRISAGIAQSFALILRIPIFSVSTLALLAEKTWRKYKKKNVLVAINAQKEKIYWAQYTRNKFSIWEGEETESLMKISLIEHKIKKMKNNWSLVGSGWKNIQSIDILDKQQKNIFVPNSYDIISFSLLAVKQKKILTDTSALPNYLNNIFEKI